MRIINSPLRMLGSEQMSLVQLFIPREVAHDTIAELGELGNVQFKDVRLGITYAINTVNAERQNSILCSSTLK